MNINLCGYAMIALVLYISLKIYQDSDVFNLKCIISNVDGKKYCVRERHKLELAADRLANVNKSMGQLVEHCYKKYPTRENIKRLKNGYNPKKVMETLPTSEYTAYSQNKGEKMAFCLNKEKDGNQLIDPNTLTFVALHELSHIATKSIGHKDEFWNNFKFLLTEATEIGIYDMVDYKKKPERYCGTDINDNPYFDL
jgi:hypothetical protein